MLTQNLQLFHNTLQCSKQQFVKAAWSWEIFCCFTQLQATKIPAYHCILKNGLASCKMFCVNIP